MLIQLLLQVMLLVGGQVIKKSDHLTSEQRVADLAIKLFLQDTDLARLPVLTWKQE